MIFTPRHKKEDINPMTLNPVLFARAIINRRFDIPEKYHNLINHRVMSSIFNELINEVIDNDIIYDRDTNYHSVIKYLVTVYPNIDYFLYRHNNMIRPDDNRSIIMLELQPWFVNKMGKEYVSDIDKLNHVFAVMVNSIYSEYDLRFDDIIDYGYNLVEDVNQISERIPLTNVMDRRDRFWSLFELYVNNTDYSTTLKTIIWDNMYDTMMNKYDERIYLYHWLTTYYWNNGTTFGLNFKELFKPSTIDALMYISSALYRERVDASYPIIIRSLFTINDFSVFGEDITCMIDVIDQFIRMNGNNLSMLAYIIKVLEAPVDRSISVHSSNLALTSPYPLEDFDILNTIFNNRVPNNLIELFAQYGKKTWTMLEEQVGTLNNNIFSIIMNRRDAEYQIMNMIIQSNDMIQFIWDYIKSNDFFASPSASLNLLKALIEFRESKEYSNMSMSNRIWMRKIMMSISEWLGITACIKEYPKILKYITVVSMSAEDILKINPDALSYLPITLITGQLVCNTLSIIDDYIPMNINNTMNWLEYDKNNDSYKDTDDCLGVENLVVDGQYLYDIIVSQKKYGYLLDVKNIGIQKKLVEIITDYDKGGIKKDIAKLSKKMA